MSARIRFACPTCKAVMDAPVERAGVKINCLKCGQHLQIPTAERAKTILAGGLGISDDDNSVALSNSNSPDSKPQPASLPTSPQPTAVDSQQPAKQKKPKRASANSPLIDTTNMQFQSPSRGPTAVSLFVWGAVFLLLCFVGSIAVIAWLSGGKDSGLVKAGEKNKKDKKAAGPLLKTADELKANNQKFYAVGFKTGTTYQIDLKSEDFDSFLYLEDSTGKKVAEDNDSGGFPDARIVYTAPKTGQYKIIVTSLDGRPGRFTLTSVSSVGKGEPGDAEDLAVIISWSCFGTCFIVLIVFVFVLAYPIFFYLTLYNAFSAVSPHNRDLEPALTFLLLIPLFNIVWYFILVTRLASSMRKEFDERGLDTDHDFGLLVGILAPLIPCVGPILMLIWLFKQRGFTATLSRTR